MVNGRSKESMLYVFIDTEKSNSKIFCFRVTISNIFIVVLMYSKATSKIIQNIDQIRQKQLVIDPLFTDSLSRFREYGAKPNIFDIK
jgi:hypothetical protein